MLDWLKIPFRIKQLPAAQQQLWGEAIPMGLLLSGLIVVIRAWGWLQVPELMAFDRLLKSRPAESISTNVVLVGITEEDLNVYGGFPLSDQILTDALTILEAGHPRAIGLDLFREKTPDPDRAKLGNYFSQSSKLIGASVVLNQQDSLNIPPAPELPPERVGFVDVILDSDHKLRRMILASRTWSGNLEYSLAMRLAIAFFQAEGIPFHHGERSSDPIRFGAYQLPRVTPNFGGYQSVDANGNQLLLNSSNAAPPFPILSLRDVLSPEFDPTQIRDRVVIVGMTAVSIKDSFYSDAIPHTVLSESFGSSPAIQGRLYGVEFHAHTVHQIISAVLENRPLIWVLPNRVESILILLVGLLGLLLGLWLRSPWKSLLGLGIALGCLYLSSLGLLWLTGLWLPLVPLSLVFVGTGLTTAFFDRDLRLLLDERRSTIIKTYEAVHNGPLQTLALLVRGVEQSQWSNQDLTIKLQSLNLELRSLYDHLEESALDGVDTLYLQDDLQLSLNPPLDQLLQQVYAHTLERPFIGFASLMVRMTPDFSGLEGLTFNRERKRSLCLFLEEALINVGKYGLGSLSLDVTCSRRGNQLTMKIINNLGAPIEVTSGQRRSGGQGTLQAKALARDLGGDFTRWVEGKRYICQLTWPVRRSPLSQLHQWGLHFTGGRHDELAIVRGKQKP